MNLTEMYEEIQKQYVVDAEKEREAKELAAKKAAEDENKLKDMIYELIHIVQNELEANCREIIYKKYRAHRQHYPQIRKPKTSLRCDLNEDGIYLVVIVSGHAYGCNDENEYARRINNSSESGFEPMKRFADYAVEHYRAERDTIELSFNFSLDENTVTITWKFEGNAWCLKEDFKKIFPEGSVHRINHVDKVILNLD
ncbi:MAG: hypothetical protein IKE91_02950 [Clostridia bacterium]|nr:hypothetical protein [Clostridia bacterium]